MEEEIEELGLPKSITSAGEESSSKAEEEAEDEKMLGPSPFDAVQRPSSADAVEGSAPKLMMRRRTGKKSCHHKRRVKWR
jgi:hypothetical protein